MTKFSSNNLAEGAGTAWGNNGPTLQQLRNIKLGFSGLIQELDKFTGTGETPIEVLIDFAKATICERDSVAYQFVEEQFADNVNQLDATYGTEYIRSFFKGVVAVNL